MRLSIYCREDDRQWVRGILAISRRRGEVEVNELYDDAIIVEVRDNALAQIIMDLCEEQHISVAVGAK